MNDLYRDADVSSGFSFDDEVLKKALKNIYSRDFHPMTSIEENLFDEIWGTMNDATDKGFKQSADPDDDFREAIKKNNAVFSAFKVHRMQNDMAARLLDSNGNLKPFEKWAKEVMPIADHQVRHWLRTEYNTAVIRAHQAADWRQFEREKDVLPNLKWMPSTSVHPGADHKIFWGTILPIDDAFWSAHRPGDRWNCKCTLTSTDEPITNAPNNIQPIDAPQKGLQSNPGKTGIIFSQDHPYFPKDCKSCAFYKPNLKDQSLHFFSASKVKNCYNCPYITNCIDKDKASKLQAKYKNGGELWSYPQIDKKKLDYKAIRTMCDFFAKQGNIVEITPSVHRKSKEYVSIYSKLIGTKYEGKCPDFSINGTFYEFEGFVKPWNKNKVGRMLSHGMIQSDHVVIDNTKGCSDRFIRKAIMARMNKSPNAFSEVWIYEKGKIRLFFKDGKFY